MNLTAKDRHLIAAPMTHGANTLILPIFAVGGTQLFMEQASPANILRAIETLRATTMFVPPTIIYMMLEEADISKRDLSACAISLWAGQVFAPMW